MRPNGYYQPVNYEQFKPNNYKVNPNDERVGGFVFPFLLGGVTGAAIAPAFYGVYNRPYYQPYPYYPYPPYYGPYYR